MKTEMGLHYIGVDQNYYKKVLELPTGYTNLKKNHVKQPHHKKA